MLTLAGQQAVSKECAQYLKPSSLLVVVGGIFLHYPADVSRVGDENERPGEHPEAHHVTVVSETTKQEGERVPPEGGQTPQQAASWMGGRSGQWWGHEFVSIGDGTRPRLSSAQAMSAILRPSLRMGLVPAA